LNWPCATEYSTALDKAKKEKEVFVYFLSDFYRAALLKSSFPSLISRFQHNSSRNFKVSTRVVLKAHVLPLRLLRLLRLRRRDAKRDIRRKGNTCVSKVEVVVIDDNLLRKREMRFSSSPSSPSATRREGEALGNLRTTAREKCWVPAHEPGDTRGTQHFSFSRFLKDCL